MKERNWPRIDYVACDGEGRHWIATCDLATGESIVVAFETAAPLDASDDEAVFRLRDFFFAGVQTTPIVYGWVQ